MHHFFPHLLAPLAVLGLVASLQATVQDPPVSPVRTTAPPAPVSLWHGAAPSETVGPWTLRAPDTAVLVAGGTASTWGWLHVVNAAVSIQDAFTGSPMLADGYANAEAGTSIEVTFSTPVTNMPGPDLVVLDARFDAGSYTVATEYDGFSATVSPSFINSGESRSYYYEHNLPGSPFSASIWGGEVDLSSLGVPAGSSVARVRFTTSDGAGDPIGLGAIVGGLTLTITGPCPGLVTVDVSGASPGGTVAIVYALAQGSFPVPSGRPCAGTVLGLAATGITLAATPTADPTGSVSLPATLPGNACGVVAVQAVDITTCTTSNVVQL